MQWSCAFGEGVFDQALEGRLGGCPEDDGGDDAPPPAGVREADDAGLRHAVEAGQDLLDGARLDLDPTGDDDVVEPAEDEKPAEDPQPDTADEVADAKSSKADDEAKKSSTKAKSTKKPAAKKTTTKKSTAKKATAKKTADKKDVEKD